MQKIGILINNITDSQNPVRNWTPISANYQKAWEEVFNKYEDHRILVSMYLDSIFKVKAANEESAQSLQSVLTGFDSNYTQLKMLLDAENLDFADVVTAHVALRKLDPKTRDLFQQHSGDKEIPVWSKLSSFLKKRANDLVVSEASTSSKFKPQTQSQDKKSKSDEPSSSVCYVAKSSTSQTRSPSSCLLSCKDAHKLIHCPKFKSL